MLKKLLLFFAALCCTILAGAESITVDGIVYNITSPDGPYIVEVGDNQSFSGTTVTIPATVTSGNITYSVTGIGGYAFVGCSELTSITIPNSVESIGGDAFLDCSGLTSVTFAEGCKLENIGGYAFVGCSGLTSITIPASVTSIGVGIFENCSSLTNIIVESDNTTYDSRDNCNAIIKKASNTLIAGCNNTIIPNSVTSIGEYAFHGCSGLTSITIPNSVASIREFAFYGCEGLTSVTIPNSVTSIDFAAFWGCKGLTGITIPNSVKSIGIAAFTDCPGLASITVDADNPNYDSRDNCNAIIEIATNTLIVGCKNTIIPNSVTIIGENAFFYSSLTSITLPNSVTSIGNSAFEGCSGLSSITLPNSVTSVGEFAFRNCFNLMNITLPNSVTSVGEFAFKECSNLTSVQLKSMPSFEWGVFNDCNSLTSITLDLTDSEKPYIGTSLDDYPAITEANYSRSSAKDKWGTIVLPFVPGSTAGLEFYELSSMTTADGGSLTFTKVDEVAAGVPYLFRNTSESADFTLTKANPEVSDFVLTPQDQEPVNGFTMKGSFQSVQLNGADKNLYYLKDNQFYHANGKININPFRAYIEGSGSASSKSFLLMIEDGTGAVNAVPGVMDDKGEIDETEGIYDLNGRRLTAPLKGQFNVIRTKLGKSFKRKF